MTPEFPLCQSGIVFPLNSRISPEIGTALLAEVFAARGEDPAILRDGGEVLFHAKSVTLRLHLAGDRARLRLTRPAESEPMTEARAQALLAALTATLIRAFSGETVLWLRKDMVLPADRFVAAVDPVRPRRVQAGVEARRGRPTVREAASAEAWEADFVAEQQIALAALMREIKYDTTEVAALHDTSLPVRMTVGIVTVFVGLFSLPIAASLLVWNTLRGGDLRVSTTMLTVMALGTLLGQAVSPELAHAMVTAPAALGL